MATIGQSGRVGPGRWWSVTITSSPRAFALRDLVDGGDPAVDGQDEPDALLDEPSEGVARDAVSLLEAARKMPDDVRAELAQEQHRESRCADAVDVVVAVDADPLALVDSRANAFDGDLHVTEEIGIVPRHLGAEESRCGLGIAVAAADEDGGRHCVERELRASCVGGRGVQRVDIPDARHANDGTDEVGRPLWGGQRPGKRVLSALRAGGGASRARPSPRAGRCRSWRRRRRPRSACSTPSSRASTA